MKTKIENPSTYNVELVIWFLNPGNVRPAEIHRQIVVVLVEGAVKEGNVRKWCRLFEEGNINVHEWNEEGPRFWLRKN